MAELYDQVRPSYPEALVDDVLAMAPTRTAPELLEVGAGTGRATTLFAARGAAVLALEPSPGMAAIAERNCSGHPAVAVERVEFERWEPRGARFDVVLAAQAWHWISPDVRCAKARSVLTAGGALAVFWNRVSWDACPLAAALDHVYRTIAPELARDGPSHPRSTTSPHQLTDFEREVEATAGLGEAEVRRYPWRRAYASEDYVSLLRTHSDHALLPEERRERLLEAVAGVIDRAGGVLELSYAAVLCAARAC